MLLKNCKAMTGNFESKFKSFKKWANLTVLPLSIAGVVCGVILGMSLLTNISLIIFALVASLSFMWFVPTGYVGYKTVLSRLVEKTYYPGLNWIIPFITDMYLMDTTVITRTITDTKKVKTRNEVTLDYTLTYKLDESLVFQVFKQMRENYWETHLAKWIDAKFDTIVSWLTYHEFQLRKDEIEEMASKLIAEEVDIKCVEMSDGMIIGRVTTRYDVHRSIESVPSADDPTQTIQIETTTLTERTVTVKGVNFFEFIDLKINKVKFEKDYEEAMAKVAVSKARTIETKELQKQVEIQAEARKKALIIEAEGKAEALRLQGASENEVRRVLGEVLKDHPELLKQELAKNFPKVFGGSTMIDLGEMLGEGK
jgi:regulator of protease activity HflC (stomatin/prohibitin superfamily)